MIQAKSQKMCYLKTHKFISLEAFLCIPHLLVVQSVIPN